MKLGFQLLLHGRRGKKKKAQTVIANTSVNSGLTTSAQKGPIHMSPANRFTNSPLLLFRGEQKAPDNATRPKTQATSRSETLRFRVCCFFGGALCSPLRGRQNTAENTRQPEIPPFQVEIGSKSVPNQVLRLGFGEGPGRKGYRRSWLEWPSV